MRDPALPPLPPDGPPRWARIALVLVTLVLAGWLLFMVLDWLQAMVGSLYSIGGPPPLSPLIVAILILYALMIALPFMPGIEVGIALLMLQGAVIAPLVYLATVLGLMTAFLAGRLIPLRWLHGAFAGLGLRRACALVAEIAATPPDRRLARQREALPRWLARLTVDYRYLSLGVLLNLPGTFAIGGGGGILLAAGLSRLFNGWVVLATLLIATLPVPLTVWMMGADG